MKILVVDDQRSARRVLRQMLASLPDVETIEAASLDEALLAIERSAPDLLLLDVRLSDNPRDRGGLEILRRVRAAGRTTPAVMVTSVSELGEIREAMRLGAQDYVFKDELGPEMLLPIIEGQRERFLLKGEVVRLRARVERSWGTGAILGTSPSIDRVRRLVERVAESSSTVLIRGETGTGKEMVARALHDLSSRSREPFVAVNCSALPGTLIESMIFGHERGAFTGAERRVRGQLELAGSGTLLLDEIAEMPPSSRPSSSASSRIAASAPSAPRSSSAARPDPRRDPRRSRGPHRSGPLPRGPVLPPQRGGHPPPHPRRARRGSGALARVVHRRARAPAPLHRRRRRLADAPPWPGNVRELRNCVERLVLLADDDRVDAAVLAEICVERPVADAATEIDRIARALLALPEKLGSSSASWSAPSSTTPSSPAAATRPPRRG